jgi:hypothetical protein
MHSPSSTPLLKDLTRYTIRQKIGSGGMATVYCADDHVLGREVALKMMHEHLINSPESVRRFSSEALAVATLSHENIVKIFDYGEFESRPYLVMEYVKGGSAPVDSSKKAGPCLIWSPSKSAARSFWVSPARTQREFSTATSNPTTSSSTKRGRCQNHGLRDRLYCQPGIRDHDRFVHRFSPVYFTGTGRRETACRDDRCFFGRRACCMSLLSGMLPFNAEVAAAVVHSIIHDTPPPVFKRNNTILFWLSDMVDTNRKTIARWNGRSSSNIIAPVRGRARATSRWPWRSNRLNRRGPSSH